MNMPKTNNALKTNERWQPSDFESNYPGLPFDEESKKSNRKKYILVSVYLVLLISSLFIL